MSGQALAATEFVTTIKSSGGDYSSLATWEGAIASDLTAATTTVIGGSLTRGSFADSVAVTQTTSNATGTMLHDTATQMMLVGLNGAPNATGTWWPTANGNDTTNAWTPTDAGDSVIAVAKIDGTWNSADTGNATITGWNTTSTNYIKIYTTTAARHNGTWGNGYRRTGTLTIQEEYVRIDGISAQSTSAGIYFINGSTGVGDVRVSNSYGQYTGNGSNRIYDIYSVGSLVIYLWNNIGISTSTNTTSYPFYVNDASPTVYMYNNTGIVASSTAFRSNTGTNTFSKNNLGYSIGSGLAFSGTFASSTYSASNDATADDWGGDGNRINQTFTFVDSANNNWHLASNDVGAKDFGVSDPGSGLFSDDIDGVTRSGTWDIGADEFKIKGTKIRGNVKMRGNVKFR